MVIDDALNCVGCYAMIFEVGLWVAVSGLCSFFAISDDIVLVFIDRDPERGNSIAF